MISHTLHPLLGFDAPVAGAPRHLRAPDAGGAQGGAAQPGWGAPQLGASLGRFLPCSKFNFQWFHGTPLGWQKVKVLSKMQQSAIESQHWQIEGGELHEFRLLFGSGVFRETRDGFGLRFPEGLFFAREQALEGGTGQMSNPGEVLRFGNTRPASQMNVCGTQFPVCSGEILRKIERGLPPPKMLAIDRVFQRIPEPHWDERTQRKLAYSGTCTYAGARRFGDFEGKPRVATKLLLVQT